MSTLVPKVTRAEVMKNLLAMLRKVNGGDVMVVRGAIDWPTWKWPKTVAISLQASENFESQRLVGQMDTLVSVTAGIRIPKGDEQQINDEILEALDEQLRAVLLATMQVEVKETHKQPRHLVLGEEWQGSREWSDLRYGVQGTRQFSILTW